MREQRRQIPHDTAGVIVATAALLIVQTSLGRTGRAVADRFSYQGFDPLNLYAWVSVHHVVQMVLGLVLIAVLSKALRLDFCFGLGDTRRGTRYVVVFTGALAVVAVVLHTAMYFSNQLPKNDTPLQAMSIIGSLPGIPGTPYLI